MVSTRIVKEVGYADYYEFIENCVITINRHAYFRFNDVQRKVYKYEYLKSILKEEHPVFVGLQQNGRYAVFFRRKEGYLRIMFNKHPKCIEIITFYITDNLPRIK
ncbi:MAG TPA: hypothetical protein VI612_02110 [Candidatus Nanoarchaeia archaeon]|nr:hypothetical protein [Candidatus Nanoarchaeia archaeon]